MFDAAGPAGDHQRREFVQHVARSTAGPAPPERPRSTTSERAVYRFVLSPRDARGLDLKRLARAAMTQLATDTGRVDLPPWIAGEHRNTAHPHVHVILAARRQLRSGEFRTLFITRERLARMKEALRLEMTRQREHRLSLTASAPQGGEGASPPIRKVRMEMNSGGLASKTPSMVETLAWTPPAHERFRREMRHNASAGVALMAARISRHHRREAERLARARHQVWDDDHRQVRSLH
jgi:hypothetical protein